MSEGRARDGLLRAVPVWLPATLIAVHVLALALVIGDAMVNPVTDVDVFRAMRIATSPATPYRDFPVEYMPLETAVLHAIAQDDPRDVALKLAAVAFLGDIAAGAAVWWGWGRRPAAMYFLLGIPLLSMLYQRFDFVVVGMAAWAFALQRRRYETSSGVVLGLAILGKLWPVVLLPILWFRRQWRAAAAGAIVLVTGGLAWAWVGGLKAPLQVLTFRGAVGWSVESTVGNLYWIISRGQIAPQAGAMRVGIAPAWAKGLLLVGLVAAQIVIWRRAARDRRDPMGGTAVASIMGLLVFSPLFSIQYATWLLPWMAVAYEGDRIERRVATQAAVAVVISALLTISYLNHSPLTSVAEKWGLFLRNAVCVWLLVTWFRGTRRPRFPTEAAPA
jgi:hypothetical protein